MLGVRVRAGLWMGLAVFSGSWFPVLVVVSGVGLGPFVFQFLYELVVAGWWLVWVLLVSPVFRGWGVWVSAGRLLVGVDGLLAVLNSLFVVFFVWASVFVDAAVVTVLVSVGSVWLFVFWRARQGGDRYARLVGEVWVFLGVAGVGVGFVVLSRFGGFVFGEGFVWGVLLALGATVCGGLVSFRFKLGERLFDGVGGGEVVCVVVVSVLANVVGGLLMLPFVVWGVGGVGGSVLWLVVLGLVGAAGSVWFRFANVVSDGLGVNVLGYLGPVLSLVWLWWFVSVGVVRVDWLVLGVAGVVAGNVLLGVGGWVR